MIIKIKRVLNNQGVRSLDRFRVHFLKSTIGGVATLQNYIGGARGVSQLLE